MKQETKDEIESIEANSLLDSYNTLTTVVKVKDDKDKNTIDILKNISKEILESQSVFLTAEHNKMKSLKEQFEDYANQIKKNDKTIKTNIENISRDTKYLNSYIRAIQPDYYRFFHDLLRTLRIGFISIGAIIVVCSLLIMMVLG